MALMRSKKAGTCNICRGDISVGDLINWDRNNGATHEPGTCEPQVAKPAERKAYLAHVTAAIEAWDGVGSFRPTAYGEFLDLTKNGAKV